MKSQNEEGRIQKSERNFGVNYRWLGKNGQIHIGRTVTIGRDRAHAERRFFNQHKHVLMEEAGCAALKVIGSLATVAFIIALMAFAVRTDDRLQAANERIDSLKFEVRTLTHTVGEIYRDRSPVLTATNIIINVERSGE
jgi:hypothetical protein